MILYQHDDGRYGIAPTPEAADFARGDPAWHRIGPVDVTAGWHDNEPSVSASVAFARASAWGRLYDVASRLAAYLGAYGTVEAKSDLGSLLLDALRGIDGDNYCPGLMPAAPVLGLVERLRNGGQPDLADMAEALVTALQALIDHADLADDGCYGTLGTSFVRDIARAAIAAASTGKPE